MKMLQMMLVVASGLASVACASMKPVGLTCDYRVDPVGVDKARPGLSWHFDASAAGAQQARYQVQVASSLDDLRAGSTDLWDSGEVATADSLHVRYAGKPLASRGIYFWRVRVWEEDAAEPGPWSEPASWEMGLVNPDDWSASWIRAENNEPVPDSRPLNVWYFATAQDRGEPARRPVEWKPGVAMPKNAARLKSLEPATWFRKDFVIEKEVASARLYSTAAGYADFYLDGKKLSGRIRNPAQTDFEKRILYDIDVLDDLLKPGARVLSAHLGQGFYGQNAGFSSDRFFYGRPALIAQLEITYTDGSRETIASDASWRTHPSAVVKNNIYAGEVFDGSRAAPGWNLPSTKIDAKLWRPASVLDRSPTQRLEVQTLPPVEAVRSIAPVKLLQPEPGVWVFDFGQNFTGFVEMDLAKLALKPGAAVWLRYAEWANAKGQVGMKSGGGFATKVNQVDTYIAGAENAKTWAPSFTWHGFRYVEVTGLPRKPELDLLTGFLTRSSVSTVGRFESSDPHLNRVHQTALWTYESNLMSIPSDCPIRERCGWTGDAHAALTLSNYNYDMALFWEKYLGDFRTNKDVAPAIVPGKRGGGQSPDWAVAQVLVAGEHYLFHADREVIADHYDQLLAFMKYCRGIQKKGIISKKYGDWCDPVRKPGDERKGGAGKPQQTPMPLTSTALFVKACSVMEDLSSMLGKDGEARKFAQWKKETVAAFNREFYSESVRSYGSQTADAMALCFDIVPDKARAQVAKSLNRDVLENWNGHASVGALGHRWLYPALADHGYADTALGTFFAKGHPGFYYLFDELNGTTLWERKGAFDPSNMDEPVRSLSHPFQGGYDAWFYMGLGGVRPSLEQPGFKKLLLRPSFPKRLDWIKVEYDSEYGPIASRWKRVKKRVGWEIEIPPNTSGLLQLNRDEIAAVAINGKTIPPSQLFKGKKADLSAYPLASGKWRVELGLK